MQTGQWKVEVQIARDVQMSCSHILTPREPHKMQTPGPPPRGPRFSWSREGPASLHFDYPPKVILTRN
jgi:hypothetical protein